MRVVQLFHRLDLALNFLLHPEFLYLVLVEDFEGDQLA